MTANTSGDHQRGLSRAETLDAVRERNCRLRQTVFGLVWLLVVAFVLASATRRPLLGVFAAIVPLSLVCTALLAFWGVGWLTRRQARGGHFNIAFLLLVILLLGVFLGFVRWLTDAMRWGPPDAEVLGPRPASAFLVVAVVSLVVLVVSMVPILGLLDSTMWALARLVNTPGVRRLIVRLRHRT